MSDNLLRKVEQKFIRDDLPNFKPGDTVKIHIKITEGNKTRIQAFQGIVISRHGNGINKMFTVRKIGAGGVGVERIFPVNAPLIDKIDVIRRGKVRRAKLYYLRSKIGKAAKVRELRTEKKKTK
ncbi:50S ribosomal protein L19 [bacterium]|nr:50S ribosomal protein L19 [bacterium]